MNVYGGVGGGGNIRKGGSGCCKRVTCFLSAKSNSWLVLTLNTALLFSRAHPASRFGGPSLVSRTRRGCPRLGRSTWWFAARSYRAVVAWTGLVRACMGVSVLVCTPIPPLKTAHQTHCQGGPTYVCHSSESEHLSSSFKLVPHN